MSWDLTRRQIRDLEARLDDALNRFSRIAADIARQDGSLSASKWPGQQQDLEQGRGAGTQDDADAMEQDIERMLIEFSSAISSLSRILEDPTMPSSASQQHALQRHREVLLDFERDYRRSKANVQQARNRKDLLGSVKSDIDAYKAKQFGGSGEDASTNALLSERSRLDNSHQMIDGTLDQAYATRADLSQQRSTLTSMSTRLTNTASQIPGLNNLIRLINRRRQRDRIIMGVVIGGCTVILLMYLTS